MFRIIGFCYINQYVSKATLIDLNIFLVNECILSWLWWLAITQIFNHHHRLNIFCWLVWLHQRLDTLDREPTPGFWLLADARFDCSNKMASFWDLNLNKKYRQMLCDTSKNSTKRRTRSSSYSIFGNRTTIFSIFKGIFTWNNSLFTLTKWSWVRTTHTCFAGMIHGYIWTVLWVWKQARTLDEWKVRKSEVNWGKKDR